MHTTIPLLGALVPIAAASLFYIGDRRVAQRAQAGRDDHETTESADRHS